MWPITDNVDLVFQVMVSDSPQEVLNAFELVQTRDHQNASAALNRRNGGPNWRGCLTEWGHAVRDDRHPNCGGLAMNFSFEGGRHRRQKGGITHPAAPNRVQQPGIGAKTIP